MFGQREVELSHDVTFDEDIALRKISNLPNPMKDKEEDVGNVGNTEGGVNQYSLAIITFKSF